MAADHQPKSNIRHPTSMWAAVLALSGCGYVGEPMYPLLNIPNRVTDLAAVERGETIIYQFTVPVLTTEGKQAKIGRIEIRAGEAPEGGFNQDEWLAKAIHLEAKPDGSGHVRNQIPAASWVGKDVILGVKVYGANGREAGWSNLVTLTVVPSLAAPTAVDASSVPEGVRVSWEGSADQYRIFRRSSREEPPAVMATVGANQWVDMTTEYGNRYEYIVQAVQKAGVSEAQSELSESREVTPIDKFPPAAPVGLNAIAATENIELVWERNTEPDLAGYRLYRATADGKLEKIADIAETPSYSDRKVESGKRYRYALTGVDRAGNESKQSEPVEIVAPQK